jgi:hypothetical protein
VTRERTPGRCIVRVLAVLLLMGMAATAPRAGATAAVAPSSASPEYMIKAAYLLNFARLIEWPRDAFDSANSPMTIGVIGADPFGQALELTVEGKKVNNRGVAVKRLQWGQDFRHCQILFISSTDSHRIGEVTSRVGSLPILIVGEADDLARRGATISFKIDDQRVRFDVNVEAAKRARLTISSQVLRVARIVREQ